MLGLILGAVLLVIFGVLAFLASNTWKASHLVLLFFVFLASLSFMAFSTAALKTRGAWKKKHDSLVKQIESKQEELRRLKFGDLASDELVSVPQFENELKKITLDRGRVWRGVIPIGPGEGNEFGLSLAKWGGDNCFTLGEEDEPAIPEGDDAAAGAALKPHGIDDGMVLYAFLESSVKAAPDNVKQALFGDSDLPTRDEQGFCRIPFVYLGSFRVVGVEGANVKISPALPLDPQQQAAIQQQSTWVLYEIMPLDQHKSLVGLTPEQLTAIFPNTPQINQIVQEYAADMQPAVGGANPERTMQRVKFLRDYEVDVDVDAEEQGLEDFDPTGRALAAELRQGAPTSFKEGDTPEIPFDYATAEKLRADGVVEFVEEAPIYVRRLRDYARGFSLDIEEIQGLDREFELLKADNDAISAAAEKARAQIAYREQEITKLNGDQEKLKAELATLSEFRRKLEEKYDQQRSQMSGLYNWNIQLADALRGFIFAGN